MTGVADVGDLLGLLTALGLGVLVGTVTVPSAPPVPYRAPTKEPDR